MIATTSIPAAFVKRAHRHLLRTGRPLVYGPLHRRDIGLSAVRNPASGRWAFVVDVGTLPYLVQQGLLAQGPSTELMLRLAKYARIAVKGLPGRFECAGQEVGRVDEADGLVVVSSGLAMSCLSYVLRHHEPRTGFYVSVLD
jgi:hypothetical protein